MAAYRFRKALSQYAVALYLKYTENTGYFSQFFADGFHDWEDFIGYSFGISRNKTSTCSYGAAFLYAGETPKGSEEVKKGCDCKELMFSFLTF